MRAVRLVMIIAAACLLAAAVAQASTRTSQTPEQIRAFKDSGSYDASIRNTYATATRYLKAQLRRRVRKPAVVLDIDETALSNYACLDAVDFDLSGLIDCAVNGKGVAIAPARAFYRLARARKVAVFWITGTPASLCETRRRNLLAQGFTGTRTLTCRPADDHNASLVPFKSAARKKLQRRGFTILANVGDQASDLAGGAARRTFKLVNPIYFTP